MLIYNEGREELNNAEMKENRQISERRRYRERSKGVEGEREPRYQVEGFLAVISPSAASGSAVVPYPPSSPPPPLPLPDCATPSPYSLPLPLTLPGTTALPLTVLS